MKIQQVQKSPNFGYNAQLNREVVAKLSEAKHSKPFFNTLIKVNELSNETEKLMRDTAIAKNKALTNKLEDVFITLKYYLASCLEEIFPKLDYSRRESISYAQDIVENHVKDESHWSVNIMNTLGELAKESAEKRARQNVYNIVIDENGKLLHVDEEGNVIKELTIEEIPPEFQEYIKEAKEKINAQTSDAENVVEEEDDKHAKKVADIVEKYIPSEEEKDGFAGLVAMNELKKTLMMRVVEPLKDVEKAKQREKAYGIKLLPSGMLLYGPPGCGKSTIAKRLSIEADLPLFMMKTGKFGTAFYHETSKNVVKAYDYAKKIATQEKPVLMLFDDCDSIFAARNDRMERFETEELTTFLDVIDDGAKNNVITIGTTNRFDIMDEAVKRRLSLHIQIPLGDLETRTALVDKTLDCEKGQALKNDRDAVNLLAQKFDGYSNDTIIKTMKEALTKVCDESNGERDIALEDVLNIMSTDEFKNKKVDKKLYETKNSRKSIGF